MLKHAIFLLCVCNKYTQASMEQFTAFMDHIQPPITNDIFTPQQIEEIMTEYNSYDEDTRQEIFLSHQQLPQQIANEINTQKLILVTTESMLTQLNPANVNFPSSLFHHFFRSINQDINGKPISPVSKPRILRIVQQKLITNPSPYATELWHRIRKLDTMRQSGWYPFVWIPKSKQNSQHSFPQSPRFTISSPLLSPKSLLKSSTEVPSQDDFIAKIKNFPSEPITTPKKHEIDSIMRIWLQLHPISRAEIEMRVGVANNIKNDFNLDGYPLLLRLQEGEAQDSDDLENAWREYIYQQLSTQSRTDEEILRMSCNQFDFYHVAHPDIRYIIRMELKSIRQSIKEKRDEIDMQKLEAIIQRYTDPETNLPWTVRLWEKIGQMDFVSEQRIVQLLKADKAGFKEHLHNLLRKMALMYNSGVYPGDFIDEIRDSHLGNTAKSFVEAVVNFPSIPILVPMENDIRRIKQLWSEISDAEKVLFCDIIARNTHLNIDGIYSMRDIYPLLLGIDEIPQDLSLSTDNNPEFSSVKSKLVRLIKKSLSMMDDEVILGMDSCNILPAHLKWMEREVGDPQLRRRKKFVMFRRSLNREWFPHDRHRDGIQDDLFMRYLFQLKDGEYTGDLDKDKVIKAWENTDTTYRKTLIRNIILENAEKLGYSINETNVDSFIDFYPVLLRIDGDYHMYQWIIETIQNLDPVSDQDEEEQMLPMTTTTE